MNPSSSSPFLSLVIWVFFFLQAPTNARELPPMSSPLHSPFPSPLPTLILPSSQSLPNIPASPSPATPPSTVMQIIVEKHHHYHKELMVATVLSSIAIFMIIISAFCAWILWRRTTQTADSKDIQSSDSTMGLALGPILNKLNSLKTSKKGFLAMVEYSTLESATNNFSESNVLGEGGFGCVYKASFDGGLLAAVKKLDHGGQECVREFEVKFLD